LQNLLGIDQYILSSLHSMYHQAKTAYDTYNFAGAYSSLVLFCRQRFVRALYPPPTVRAVLMIGSTQAEPVLL
jgi:isoleucyl-tRNA synthetase